jgi:4a-hydroxytetrahydrobiopterin dehydratase
MAPPALNAVELEAFLKASDGWRLCTGHAAPALHKRWRVADFAQAMALAQAVAQLAERLNHHPELRIGHGHCTVCWTTHDAGGVTVLDLEAARHTDALAHRPGVAPESA